MKSVVKNEVYGEIVYDENFWSGKKTLSINGINLAKKDKKTFILEKPEGPVVVHVIGNIYNGEKIEINQDVIILNEKATWYEMFCSISIFLLIIIWGGNAELCRIVPIVGGAIGGGISGGMSYCNLIAMKQSNQVWKKLLIWLGFLIGTIFICYIVAALILSTID